MKDPKSHFWHSPHLCVGGVQSGDAFFCLNFGPKTPLFKLLYLVLGVDVIPGGVFRGGGPPPGGVYPRPKQCFGLDNRTVGQELDHLPLTRGIEACELIRRFPGLFSRSWGSTNSRVLVHNAPTTGIILPLAHNTSQHITFYLSDNVVPISTSESEQQVTSVADERTGERQFGPKPPISRPPPGGPPPPGGGVYTPGGVRK